MCYIIITISTLLFFAISLLVTAGTAKEVQDGYWKIAVLRKLTVISKKLDNVQISTNSKPISTEKLSSTIHKVITDSLEDDTEDLKETKTKNTKKSEKKEN